MAKKNRGKLDDTMASMFSNVEYRTTYLFYAHMISQCSIKIYKGLPAAAGVAFMYDHFNLYINPDMFDKEPLTSRLGILKHEMLHILNGHVERKEERIHKPWNYATDCAINQLIERTHLPDYVIYPDNLSKFIGVPVAENQSSEIYYDLMKQQYEKQKEQEKDENGDSGDQDQGSQDGQGDQDQGSQDGQGSSPGERLKDLFEGQGQGQGECRPVDSHDTWGESKGDPDLQKDMTKKMIEHSQNETIKGKGTVPSGCSDWLEMHSRKSEVNWKRILRGIVGNKRVGRRSTIMRSDRRFPSRDDLRGKLKDRMFNLLVIADVSGSMSDKAVLNTLGEVRHICDVTKTDVDLIQIDTQAYKPEKLSKGTKLIERKGCGGTTLNPALDMAREHGIDYQAVVVLTDGGLFGDDITYFQRLNKKVIWLVEPSGYLMDEMNTGRMQGIKLKEEECQ